MKFPVVGPVALMAVSVTPPATVHLAANPALVSLRVPRTIARNFQGDWQKLASNRVSVSSREV
ncbi:hypothetical protein [Mycobacterium numidiamassiliense]|uniref:hypothetical protein n=1 Tax=Mycobacterium numidiamassiliense TaxID=1841861 RepID=UPI001054D130|nr:hypothetical protein [Mycobacterium numidiamassiliense]